MGITVDLDFANELSIISSERASTTLKELNRQWNSRFEFPELNSDMKKALSQSIVVHLNSDGVQCAQPCLEFVKLMSRDKTNLDCFVSEDLMNCLVKFAKYDCTDLISTDTLELVLEAQKCLCNLVFQSEKARRLCCDKLVVALCQRVSQNANENPVLTYDIKFFDLRLLFLITALCADVRPKCQKQDCNLSMPLYQILDLLNIKTVLNNQDVDMIDEALKVLFNILLSSKLVKFEEAEMESFLKLTVLLRELLLHKTETKDKSEELKNNTVNLLTVMPSVCYEKLVVPVNSQNKTTLSDTNVSSDISIYDGYDMVAVDVLLDFLYQRLDKPLNEQKESLSPILTLLTEMARSCKVLRKYMRSRVLPPLRDVSQRPEEGSTLRNRLVKLMTSVTDIKDLVAEFVFQLCKCSVDRMIKYTGFGNAAGLLSNYGLLGGGKNREAASSDSENSDTEEYLKAKSSINPVLGCVEKLKPNPMEGMSEEQKEYEAMKLVEEINKLMNKGIMVPGRVGEDGKVHPIEHILEMKERSGNQPDKEDNDDDD